MISLFNHLHSKFSICSNILTSRYHSIIIRADAISEYQRSSTRIIILKIRSSLKKLLEKLNMDPQQPQRGNFNNNNRNNNYYVQPQVRSDPYADEYSPNNQPTFGQRQYYQQRNNRPQYHNQQNQQQFYQQHQPQQNRRANYYNQPAPPRNDYFRQPPPPNQMLSARSQPQSSSAQLSQQPVSAPVHNNNFSHNRDSPRHMHTNSGFRNNNNNHGNRSGPSRYNQSSQAMSSRSRREEQELKRQAQEREVEEFMRNLKCDNITLSDIKLLDITPPIYNELVSPGKAAMYLNQIITMCKNQFKKVEDLKTDYRAVNKDVWVCWLTMNWPQQRSFIAKASNKKDAKNLAALAAIHHLRTSNSIDSNLRVQMSGDSSSGSFLDQTRGPVLINPIPMSLKQQMMSFISKYDECIESLIEYQIAAAKKSYDCIEAGDIEGKHLALDEGVEFEEGLQTGGDAITNKLPANTIIDIFTSRPYTEANDLKIRNAWSQLKIVFEKKEKKIDTDDNFYDMMSSQDRLPTRSLKSQIMSSLKSYRAIVIAGDTGCGKSTQVPQFILENFVADESNSQSYVNVAVTQPRRISAISLAERVAAELGENGAGHTVGHQVRFDAKLPSRDINAIMFFTTGMLLRKLHRNADLKGITHLVIDEVHERDCTTDFLLILIKRLLTRRRDLRVIFMSASMDASLFSQYFDNCPIISVPGRCFPVQNLYLEDIADAINVNCNNTPSTRNPRLNLDLIVQLIQHIDVTRDPGSILCFMPGWKEMKALQKELESLSDRKTRNKLKVYLAHSKLPLSEQRLIFGRVGEFERKVVLATNIAETSITINDVAYVIDCGLCNSIDYDQDLNMSTFGTRWISKANAKQRSGRAGRTCPGECFRLYRREDEAKFNDFPNPELLRIPLESVIMEVKCHCPNEKSVTFLSQAIQHPSSSAINSALEELISLRVLNQDENLTVLGKRISGFTTHPRLSVALVLAAALRCLYPILNASAMLSSTQDPFLTMQIDKQKLRDIKKKFLLDALGSKPNKESANYMSDHIALASLLKNYDSAAMSRLEGEYFVEENHLNRSAMANIQECRNLYARMLVAANFTNTYEWYSVDSLPNMNMDENVIVVSSLVQGFYPKIVRIIRGLVKNGRVYPNKISPLDSKSNQRVRLAGESIVKNVAMGKDKIEASGKDESDDDSDYNSQFEAVEERKPNFITYLNSRMDQETGLIVIRDGSVVQPHSLLLFGGADISLQDYKSSNSNEPNSGNMVVMTLDRNSLLSFRMTKDDAIALREWRSVWQRYFDWFVHTKNSTVQSDSNDEIIGNTMSEFLKITKMVFNSCR